MKILSKQRPVNILLIYMISALLFLTSIELHIHTQEAASIADHGSAVSISTLASNTTTDGIGSEITVSPEGVLKVEQHVFNLLVMLLFVAIVASAQRCIRIARLKLNNAQIPYIPFQGTPPLRAPPQ